MSVASAIFDLLAQDTVVTGIVGQRFYPSQPKQDAKPPFLFQETISADRPGLLTGVCPLKNYQVQITSVCTSEPELRMLMDAIEQRLDGLRMGNIRGCQLNDDSTNPTTDWPTEYSDSQTYSVWYARNYVRANVAGHEAENPF